MEDEIVSTEKLLRLARIQENNIFNKSASRVREQKALIEKLCHVTSPVYHRRRKPLVPGHLVCRSSDFQLIPFDPRTRTNTPDDEDHNEVTENTTWIFQVKNGRFSRIPVCNKTRQSWLSHLSQEIWRPPTVMKRSPLLLLPPSRQSDISSLTSNASTPLLVMPRRHTTETLLLNRPFVFKPLPLEVSDDLFRSFSKAIDLKAFPFKKIADSYRFYKQNFPLLMTRNVPEGERSQTPSKRSRTPESPMTIMLNRQRELNVRVAELDWLMTIIHHESDSDEFVTELDNDVFNPTKWPWTNIDVAGFMRRRFTIDEAMKGYENL